MKASSAKENNALWRVSAAVLSLVLTPLLMFVLGIYIVKWLGMENNPAVGRGVPVGLAAMGLASAVLEVARAIKKYNRVITNTNSQNKYK